MPGTGRQFPPFVAPMLATPAPELPPDADQWTAEVKWDGMRAIAAVAGGQVRIWSRAGRDVTAAYPELAALGSTRYVERRE